MLKIHNVKTFCWRLNANWYHKTKYNISLSVRNKKYQAYPKYSVSFIKRIDLFLSILVVPMNKIV